MRLIRTAFFILTSSVITLQISWAVNIAPGDTITEAFSIGTSATATLPTDWKADKNTNVRSVGTYSAAGTATEQRAGNNMSTSAANGIYNYGAGPADTATDRAVGGLSSSSGSQSVNVYTKLTNTGGSTINSFTISFSVEKYRNGSNAAGFRMQMYYSTDGTNWTDAGSDFVCEWNADANNNGFASAPGDTKTVNNKTLNVAIAPGNTLYLAWNYSVRTGTTTSSAQGLGLDDFSITANGSAGPPAPNVTITNPASAVVTVPSSTSSYTLYGTNANIAGYLTVSNNTVELTSTLAPTGNAWSYNVLSLNMGTNLIVVTGTNTAGTRATASVRILRVVYPPQNLIASATGPTEVSLSWQKNAQNNNVLLVRHTAPITGTPSGSYTAGDPFPGGGTVVYVGGDTSFDDSDRTPATTYYYKLWSVDGSTYSTGITASATTPNVVPPVATAATEVNQTSFTANWTPVSGAAGYLFDAATNQFGGTASDLFISEYCEGSSNNKYLEIYNGTGTNVNLSSYTIKIAFNGGTWGSDISLGSGILTNGYVFVIANNQCSAAISNYANAYSGSINFNGNDAVGLFKSGTPIDIIGVEGVDPGTEWPVGTMGTADNTLVRKSSVTSGNTSWATGSNEWLTYAIDTFTYLGSHTMSGGGGTAVFVPGYSNLFVAGTSVSVTGLIANSWYYYRVRAIVGPVTSEYSNVMSVKTAGTPLPFVDITVPPTNSTVNTVSFLLQGTNNQYAVGGMIVSNLTTGAAWAFDVPGAPYGWSQSVALQNGINQVRVVVTNNAGAVAFDTVTLTYSPILPDSFVAWSFTTPSGVPDWGNGVISHGAAPVVTNWPFGGGSYGGNGLIFTEIMVNPSGTESSGNQTTEWLELYNTGPVPVNLLNYAVGDANISYGGLTNIVGAAQIDVGEFVVICPPGRALGLTSAWNLVGVKVYEVGSSWPNYNNDAGGDRVYLSNTVDNVVVDEFTYTAGWPAFNSGQSMYLIVPNPTKESNDVVTAWAATPKTAQNAIPNPGSHGGVTWGSSDYGSPGRGPYQDTYDSFLQCLGSAGWPATQDNNKYVQFAFNTNMTQVSIYMDVRRDANGPQSVLVQYSTDGVTWENGDVFSLPAADTWYAVSNMFPLAQFQNVANAGIRLVAYGAGSTAGELWIDNVYGTGIVPEPAGALLMLAGVLVGRRLRQRAA